MNSLKHTVAPTIRGFKIVKDLGLFVGTSQIRHFVPLRSLLNWYILYIRGEALYPERVMAEKQAQSALEARILEKYPNHTDLCLLNMKINIQRSRKLLFFGVETCICYGTLVVLKKIEN
jgi:hypothetical protein